MPLAPNTLLQSGKYKIVRFLSSGGFGCTYEGEHVMLNKRIAIKEFFVKDFCNRDEKNSHVTVGIKSKAALVEKLRNKFIDEAVALSQLSHPNIVSVSDVFEENGTAYYVMDYVDGQSLHEIVKERRALLEQEVLKYVEQITDALEYVHSQNRLHLDIKPGNIIVAKLGKVKLIDFGASKQYDEVNGENTSTLLCKTPGYAPIEQMGNTVRTFTPATDIYALGATMYKCLTGVTPPDATLMASGEEDLAPLPACISENIRNAVYNAMQTNKIKRPQSIEDFKVLLSPVERVNGNESTMGNDEKNIIDIDPKAGTKEPIHQVNSFKTFAANGVSFDMVKVKAGTFTMGATSEMKDPDSDEKPTHQVALTRDYYIGKTEVTQALWKAVMGNNPSNFKGDNLPVECVSWNECNKFISKLNSMTGQNFRLPTETEWEFAARGGNDSNHFQYSGSNTLGDVAWYCRNSGSRTHTVATKKPNELGIYDMSGNVWEWCSDWYGDYSSSSQTNPTGPNSGSFRVFRGGSWNYGAGYCRSSDRSYYSPDFSFNHLGLRLALVP